MWQVTGEVTMDSEDADLVDLEFDPTVAWVEAIDLTQDEDERELTDLEALVNSLTPLAGWEGFY